MTRGQHLAATRGPRSSSTKQQVELRRASPGPWRPCSSASGAHAVLLGEALGARPSSSPAASFADLERRAPDQLFAVGLRAEHAARARRAAAASTRPATSPARGARAPARLAKRCARAAAVSAGQPGRRHLLEADLQQELGRWAQAWAASPRLGVGRRHVGRGHRAGQLPDAQDHARALAHRDGAARVEHVEGVRRLQAPVVGRRAPSRPPGQRRGSASPRPGSSRRAAGGARGRPARTSSARAGTPPRAAPRRRATSADHSQLVDVVHVLQVHADALEPVGDLARDRARGRCRPPAGSR